MKLGDYVKQKQAELLQTNKKVTFDRARECNFRLGLVSMSFTQMGINLDMETEIDTEDVVGDEEVKGVQVRFLVLAPRKRNEVNKDFNVRLINKVVMQ